MTSDAMRKNQPGGLRQMHKVLPKQKSTSLSTTSSKIGGNYLSGSLLLPNDFLEASTPDYSCTERILRDDHVDPSLITQPPSNFGFPQMFIDSAGPYRGFRSPQVALDPAQTQPKIMSPIPTQPETPGCYPKYLTDVSIWNAPYAFTSVGDAGADLSVPSFPQPSQEQDQQALGYDMGNAAKPGINIVEPTYLYDGCSEYSKAAFNRGASETREPASFHPWSSHKSHFSQHQPPIAHSNYPSQCHHCDNLRTLNHGIKPIYKTHDEFVVHLWKAHRKSSEWKTTKCLWGGCVTPSMFTTLKPWLDHVRIKHQKDCYCQHGDCENRRGGPKPRAFGSPASLKRHTQSKHELPVYCDKPACGGKEKLNRSDKRAKHELTHHGPIQCEIIDCPRRHRAGINYGFSSEIDRDEHMQNKHPIAMDDADAMSWDRGTTTAQSPFDAIPNYQNQGLF